MFHSSVKVLILVVAAVNAALLPDYFDKCSLSSPNLNKCLTKNANEAWPIIIKGDKDVHLQQLDPLNVPLLSAVINDNLSGNVSDAFVTGLGDIKFDEIKFDQEKKVMDVYFLTPRFNIFGQYSTKGQLIGLPFTGQGIVNNTFYNFSSHFHFEYELIENKGQNYIDIVKHSLEYNTTRIHIDMKEFGEMVNQILNENWEAVNKEISKSFAEVFSEVFAEILKPFFKKVSYEELFFN